MAFNGNGALDAADQPQVLDIGSGICADDPLYTQLGCTCSSGLTTFDSCTATEPFCKNCTKDWPMPLDSGANLIDPVSELL
jgi:hypothetical protein